MNFINDVVISTNNSDSPCLSKSKSTSVYCDAAKFWFGFGFNVIPIIPDKKQTSVKWNPWLEKLSEEAISAYWATHSSYQLGFIVGPGVVVLDADSVESQVALADIEFAFDVMPNLIVKTKKGVHHYFRLSENVSVTTDSHSTDKHPNRIDVKASRSLVILPPSKDKSISLNEANGYLDLTLVDQAFIDAVFRHNGRISPSQQSQTQPVLVSSVATQDTLNKLRTLLNLIEPDCGYTDWLNTLMAVFHETAGSEIGFEIVNNWSSQGKKYKGVKDIRAKWQSFRVDQPNPITIATLIKLANKAGVDWITQLSEVEDQFELCDTEVIKPATIKSELAPHKNPLDKYSLKGMAAELEKEAVEQVYVLGQIALKGQATVLYAAPNIGKTLLTFSLLTQAISEGLIDPSKTYYVNVDDTHTGLIEKLAYVDELQFNMMAEGYNGFKARDFCHELESLANQNLANGVVVILDTTKKFTNLMDKNQSSNFTNVIRAFCMKGGTVIALAHVNKHLSKDGLPIPAGTSDMKDDFDCAYTLSQLGVSSAQGEKVVVFDNIKRRGNVIQRAAYSYSDDRANSYSLILASVSPVDESKIDVIKRIEEEKSDSEIITAIQEAITKGINTKMKLSKEVAIQKSISRLAAAKVIEKYTGSNQIEHKWDFSVRERGAKVYVLLEESLGAT